LEEKRIQEREKTTEVSRKKTLRSVKHVFGRGKESKRTGKRRTHFSGEI